MKYSHAIFMVVLFSVFFLVVPFVHIFQNRASEFVRQIRIDGICTIAGLLGLFTASALLGLHRRLSAVEKTTSLPRKNS